MPNLQNFSNDEELIIYLIVASQLLVENIADLTKSSPEQIMAESSMIVGEFICDLSEEELKSILDNARGEYVMGEQDAKHEFNAEQN